VVDPNDLDLLRAHREELLAAQGLTHAELARRTGHAAMMRDLVVALAYSAYAVPTGIFVMREGGKQGHVGLSAAITTFAMFFFAVMWRSFIASRRRWARAKSYEGVLTQKHDDAHDFVVEFEGGSVAVPWVVYRELVPGVRYRVHAPGTDEVAVDVAVVDDVSRTSAYR
jgi:hypothetical protein